jgi:class 3 adenylate cyclase
VISARRAKIKHFAPLVRASQKSGAHGCFGSRQRPFDEGLNRSTVSGAAAIAATVQPIGLTVRSGLHTGEIGLNRDDIGSIAVHTTARWSPMAGPGETLASRTLRDLVAGFGLRFVDRGLHSLRDQREEVHLYLTPFLRSPLPRCRA